MDETLNDFDITSDYDRSIIFYAPLRESLKLTNGSGNITQIPEAVFKTYNGNSGVSLSKDQYLKYESYSNLPQSGSLIFEFCATNEQQCRSKTILFNYGISPNTIKIFIKNNILYKQIGHFTDILISNIKINKWYNIKEGIVWNGIDTRRNPYFYLGTLKYPFTGYIRNVKINKILQT
jgi:hypothetical protein